MENVFNFAMCDFLHSAVFLDIGIATKITITDAIILFEKTACW